MREKNDLNHYLFSAQASLRGNFEFEIKSKWEKKFSLATLVTHD